MNILNGASFCICRPKYKEECIYITPWAAGGDTNQQLHGLFISGAGVYTHQQLQELVAKIVSVLMDALV